MIKLLAWRIAFAAVSFRNHLLQRIGVFFVGAGDEQPETRQLVNQLGVRDFAQQNSRTRTDSSSTNKASNDFSNN